jgi:hypothetical protein
MRTAARAPERTSVDLNGNAIIETCGQCHAHLGLVAPRQDLPAKAWLCGRCGSAYLAADRQAGACQDRVSSARETSYEEVVEVATVVARSHRQPVPHRDLYQVLKYLSGLEHTGDERRREPRHAVAIPVLALPLDGTFRVAGAAVELTTINVSRSGAAFIDEATLSAAYLSIDFSYVGLGMIHAVLEVLRVRPVLSAYEVAGRWVCRVNPFRFSESGGDGRRLNAAS